MFYLVDQARAEVLISHIFYGRQDYGKYL
ncbi:MAG: hypothetical protein LBT15_05415 [Synergistaceae bacterium]|nr:hypothetical protein [Synergistaceae bacterium]